jgi:hypothetical protein
LRVIHFSGHTAVHEAWHLNFRQTIGHPAVPLVMAKKSRANMFWFMSGEISCQSIKYALGQRGA